MIDKYIFTRDRDWDLIDGQICRVTHFKQIAKMENGRVVSTNMRLPYAQIEFECSKIGKKSIGTICHKLDFQHLYFALYEHRLDSGQEVNISYIRSRLKGVYKLFSPFMPKFAVMICHAGAYELLNDSSLRPELKGEARFAAEGPLIQLIPEILQ